MAAKYYQKAEKTTPDPESGAIAVEFIFLLPLILLILAGIVELGNMWHVQHALTNASREGARAAVVYVANASPDRGTWAKKQAEAAVNNCLGKFLPAGEWSITDADIIITPLDASKPADLEGASLTVRVRATNYLLLLDKIIPAFANTKVEAAETMRME